MDMAVAGLDAALSCSLVLPVKVEAKLEWLFPNPRENVVGR